MTSPAAAAVADPQWLAHRYDPDRDLVHFVAADRAARDAATFLTDEHLPGAGAPLVIARGDALAAAPTGAPLHFVFHAAYCCSTLLARVVDQPGWASTLKEPVALNDLVGWRHRGGPPARVGAALDGVLRLLARPFEPGEAVVVKPSNVVNGLAEAMLRMRPGAGAVLLHAPLRVYLASIARKGMWGRLWVRDLLGKQLADGMVDLGFAPADYLGLTDLQVAAVGWLAQVDLYARLAARFPGRVRTLDSEVLLARPGEALSAIAALFRLPLAADRLAAMLASPAFGRNAKDGRGYDAGDRVREQADGAAIHAEEIDKVLVWAEAVARRAGVALSPPAPLIA